MIPLPQTWEPLLTDNHSHTICTFVFLEMHRKAYRTMEGLEDSIL